MANGIFDPYSERVPYTGLLSDPSVDVAVPEEEKETFTFEEVMGTKKKKKKKKETFSFEEVMGRPMVEPPAAAAAIAAPPPPPKPLRKPPAVPPPSELLRKPPAVVPPPERLREPPAVEPPPELLRKPPVEEAVAVEPAERETFTYEEVMGKKLPEPSVEKEVYSYEEVMGKKLPEVVEAEKPPVAPEVAEAEKPPVAPEVAEAEKPITARDTFRKVRQAKSDPDIWSRFPGVAKLAGLGPSLEKIDPKAIYRSVTGKSDPEQESKLKVQLRDVRQNIFDQLRTLGHSEDDADVMTDNQMRALNRAMGLHGDFDKPEIGTVEQMGRWGRNWKRMLPIVGQVDLAASMADTIVLAERIHEGYEPTQSELKDLRNRYEELTEEVVRGKGFGAGVVDLLAMLPAFGLEIAALRGRGARGRSLKPSLLVKQKRVIATLGSALAKTVALSAKGAATVMSVRTIQNGLQRLMPAMSFTEDDAGNLRALIIKPDKSILRAFGEGYTSTVSEILSEFSGKGAKNVLGVVWAKLPKETRERLVKIGIFRGWAEAQKAQGKVPKASRFKKLVEFAGWDGAAVEMGEERLNEFMMAPIDGYNRPEGKQLLTELIGFMIPGVAIQTTAMGLEKLFRPTPVDVERTRKTLQKRIDDPKTSPKHREVLSLVLEDLNRRGEDALANPEEGANKLKKEIELYELGEPSEAEQAKLDAEAQAKQQQQADEQARLDAEKARAGKAGQTGIEPDVVVSDITTPSTALAPSAEDIEAAGDAAAEDVVSTEELDRLSVGLPLGLQAEIDALPEEVSDQTAPVETEPLAPTDRVTEGGVRAIAKQHKEAPRKSLIRVTDADGNSHVGTLVKAEGGQAVVRTETDGKLLAFPLDTSTFRPVVDTADVRVGDVLDYGGEGRVGFRADQGEVVRIDEESGMPYVVEHTGRQLGIQPIDIKRHLRDGKEVMPEAEAVPEAAPAPAPFRNVEELLASVRESDPAAADAGLEYANAREARAVARRDAVAAAAKVVPAAKATPPPLPTAKVTPPPLSQEQIDAQKATEAGEAEPDTVVTPVDISSRGMLDREHDQLETLLKVIDPDAKVDRERGVATFRLKRSDGTAKTVHIAMVEEISGRGMGPHVQRAWDSFFRRYGRAPNAPRGVALPGVSMRMADTGEVIESDFVIAIGSNAEVSTIPHEIVHLAAATVLSESELDTLARRYAPEAANPEEGLATAIGNRAEAFQNDPLWRKVVEFFSRLIDTAMPTEAAAARNLMRDIESGRIFRRVESVDRAPSGSKFEAGGQASTYIFEVTDEFGNVREEAVRDVSMSRAKHRLNRELTSAAGADVRFISKSEPASFEETLTPPADLEEVGRPRKVKFDEETKTWPDGQFFPIGDRLNSVFLREELLSLVPSREELEGLDEGKKKGIWKNRKLDKGTRVGLRIDIPFFLRTGKYVIAIHAPRPTPNSYDFIARLKGPVTFSTPAIDAKARGVLFGGQIKSPFAVVTGVLDKTPINPEDVADIPDIDSWVPVGFNPHKATFYYDKRSGREVKSGTDAISIGNTVYTRSEDIEYGDRVVPTGEPSYEILQKAMEEPKGTEKEAGVSARFIRKVDAKNKQGDSVVMGGIPESKPTMPLDTWLQKVADAAGMPRRDVESLLEDYIGRHARGDTPENSARVLTTASDSGISFEEGKAIEAYDGARGRLGEEAAARLGGKRNKASVKSKINTAAESIYKTFHSRPVPDSEVRELAKKLAGEYAPETYEYYRRVVLAAEGAAHLAASGEHKMPFDKWQRAMQRKHGKKFVDAELYGMSNALLKRMTDVGATIPEMKEMTGSYERGEYAKDWYTDQYPGFLNLFGKKLIDFVLQALTVTSTNTTIKANTSLGLRSIDAVIKGRDPQGLMNTVANMLRDAMQGKRFGGNKLYNFYRALMGDTEAVVIDRWMLRAFGFTISEDNPKAAINSATMQQYQFIEAYIRQIARRTGATPVQVQSAIWTTHKGEHQLREGDALVDYVHDISDRIEKLYGKRLKGQHLRIAFWESYGLLTETNPERKIYGPAQVAVEATPNATTGVLPGMADATYEQRQEYTDDIRAAIKPHVDRYIEDLGLNMTLEFSGPGLFLGDRNPGFQLVFKTRAEGRSTLSRKLSPTHHKALRDLSAFLGYYLRQEAVAFHRPFYTTTKKRADGSEFRIDPQYKVKRKKDKKTGKITETSKFESGRVINDAEMDRLYDAVIKVFGEKSGNDVAIVPAADGVRLLNFSNTSNPVFHNLVEKAYNIAFPEGSVDIAMFRNVNGGYIANDWKVDTNGESYIKRIRRSGRPNVLRGLHGELSEAVTGVNTVYSSKHGWGNPGQFVSDIVEEADRIRIGELTGEFQETGVPEDVRERAGQRRERIRGETLEGDGRGYTNFFSDVTEGKRDKSKVPYDRVIPLGKRKSFSDDYDEHRGNFDDHIAKSIPGFADVQVMVGDAIARTYGDRDSSMVDIGASEGSLVKTITQRSDGNVRTLGVDPNVAMASFFRDHSTVPGSSYAMQAFATDEGWVEDDGTVITPWQPTEKYDVAHEAMVFQFISNTRNAQIREMKRILKPDGVAVVEEKVSFNPLNVKDRVKWDSNENHKNEYKEKYFDLETLKKKERDVLEREVEGMHELMVPQGELEATLRKHFKHVVMFWEAGNFKGYAASDSRIAVDRLVANIGDTNTEFTVGEATPHAAVEVQFEETPIRITKPLRRRAEAYKYAPGEPGVESGQIEKAVRRSKTRGPSKAIRTFIEEATGIRPDPDIEDLAEFYAQQVSKAELKYAKESAFKSGQKAVTKQAKDFVALTSTREELFDQVDALHPRLHSKLKADIHKAKSKADLSRIAKRMNKYWLQGHVSEPVAVLTGSDALAIALRGQRKGAEAAWRSGKAEGKGVAEAVTRELQKLIKQIKLINPKEHKKLLERLANARTPGQLEAVAKSMNRKYMQALTRGEAPGEMVMTAMEALRLAKRSESTGSHQGYRSGRVDLNASQIQLLEFANEHLPKHLRSRVMKSIIVNARTPSSRKRFVVAVNRMVERFEKQEAISFLKQQLKSFKRKGRKHRLESDIENRIDALMDGIDLVKRTPKTLTRLRKLMDAVRQQVSDSPLDGIVDSNALNIPDAMYTRAKEILSKDRTISQLSVDEVKSLGAAINTLLRQNADRQVLRTAIRERNKSEAGRAAMRNAEIAHPTKLGSKATSEEMPKLNSLKWFAWFSKTNWMNKVKLLVGDNNETHKILVDDLLEAENLRREYVHEAQTYLQRALKRIGYSPEKLEAVSGAYAKGRIVRKAKPFLEKNKIKIILPTATWGPTGTRVGELSLTPMEYASLLLHLADPSTRRELLRNPQQGLRIRSQATSAKRPIKLREGDMREIMRNAPADVVAVADAIQFDINGRLRNQLNEVWQRIFGYPLVTGESIYMPRRRYRGGRDDVDYAAQPESLLGGYVSERLDQQGIFLERGASNDPFVIDDALGEYFMYVQRTAAMAAKSEPIANAMRILNYKAPGKSGESFKQTVRDRLQRADTYFKSMEDHLRKFGGVDTTQPGVLSALIGKLIRPLHVANLGLKPYIWFYQMVSMNTAGQYIGRKHLYNPKNEGRLHPNRIKEEMVANSPLIRDRVEGGGHQIITAFARTNALRQFLGGENDNIFVRKSMQGILEADLIVIRAIWGAAKMEGRDKGLSGQELMDYTKKKAEFVINYSQPTWDTLTSSEQINYARQNQAVALVFGLFYSSQRDKNFNMNFDAALTARQEVREGKDPRAAYSKFAYNVAHTSFVSGFSVALIRRAYWWMFGLGLAAIGFGDDDDDFWADVFHDSITRTLGGSWIGVGDWVGYAYTGVKAFLETGEARDLAKGLRRNILAESVDRFVVGTVGETASMLWNADMLIRSFTDQENLTDKEKKKLANGAYLSKKIDQILTGTGMLGVPTPGIMAHARKFMPHTKPTRVSLYGNMAKAAKRRDKKSVRSRIAALKKMGASRSQLYSSIKNRKKNGMMDGDTADWLKNEVNLYY